MSNHAVTAIHRDANSGQIQRVYWCRTNDAGDHLQEEPHEADVAELVHAIADGSKVFPLFRVGGMNVFGPRLTIERTGIGGREQLRLVDVPRRGRSLRDLPGY